MSVIRDAMIADRRLALLRLLVEAGGQCGESSLEKALKALGFGTMLDRDQVRSDLKHLKETDCVELEYFEGRIMVAAITKRGVSAQAGNIEIPGVSAPSMGR
ncbi:hypothetical protein BH10PSE5_BH10PSE5_01370 [soil metagenome]